jgi:hypothetical protein
VPQGRQSVPLWQAGVAASARDRRDDMSSLQVAGVGRTPALERWSSHVASMALVASGVALHVMKDWLKPADEFSVVSHPLQPLALHAHVLAAPLFVLSVGMLLRDHVLPRASDVGFRRARRSGLTGALLLAPMILSGYLLQVVTSETALAALKWTHLATGALFAVAYVTHLAVTWRRAS